MSKGFCTPEGVWMVSENLSVGRAIAEGIMLKIGMNAHDHHLRDPLVEVACKVIERSIPALGEESQELENIRQRLINAGVKNFSSPLQGVSLLCRLLDESQGEALSLRRRISELLSHIQIEPQSAHSTEVCVKAEGKSSEGDSPKRESDSNG